MAYCRVLLCNINKKSSCCNGGFLFISNKHLVTFHFPLAIYHFFYFNLQKNVQTSINATFPRIKVAAIEQKISIPFFFFST